MSANTHEWPHEGLSDTKAQELVSGIQALIIGQAYLQHIGNANYDRELMTSVHEAGHAIVMTAAGSVLEKVWIDPKSTGKFGGACEIANRRMLLDTIDLSSAANDPYMLVAPMVQLIAGYAGEVVLGNQGENPPAHNAAHELAICLHLSVVISNYFNITVSNIISAIFGVACEVIKRNEKLARYFAEALKVKGVITGQELADQLSAVEEINVNEIFKSLLSLPPPVPAAITKVLNTTNIFFEATNEFSSWDIASPIKAHPRIIVGFSGGKDSIVLAHMLEPYADRVELVWVNTGAMFPHMEKFVREYGKRFRLVELTSNQPARLAAVGMPSDVVPLKFISRRDGSNLKDAKVTDSHSCCYHLRAKPLYDYINSTNGTLFIHGQKGVDGVFFHPYPELSGKAVLAPLHNWTDDMVMAYIKQHNLPLPEQYDYTSESLECWSCTAAISKKRITYMREKYPEYLSALKQMTDFVYGAIGSELARLNDGITEFHS